MWLRPRGVKGLAISFPGSAGAAALKLIISNRLINWKWSAKKTGHQWTSIQSPAQIRRALQTNKHYYRPHLAMPQLKKLPPFSAAFSAQDCSWPEAVCDPAMVNGMWMGYDGIYIYIWICENEVYLQQSVLLISFNIHWWFTSGFRISCLLTKPSGRWLKVWETNETQKDCVTVKLTFLLSVMVRNTSHGCH